MGESRVWINPDPEVAGEIADAITTRTFAPRSMLGTSRPSPRRGTAGPGSELRLRRGPTATARAHGHRKGAKGARTPRKEQWMAKIRALRKRLRELREGGQIDLHAYRMLYRKSKGGEYRSTAHLNAYIKAKGLSRGE